MIPPANFEFSFTLKYDLLHFKGGLATKYYDQSNIILVYLQLFSTISDQFSKAAVVALVYL